MEHLFVVLMVMALVAPATLSRSWVPIAAAIAIVQAYAIGVANEREFPGDRAIPDHGEAVYWAALLVLVVVAGLLAVPSKK